MAEAIGLASAAIGLASELFVSVLRTCEFISTAQKLALDAPVLYWKFRVEATRLRAFGVFWGLGIGNSRAPDAQEENHEVVYGILCKMRDLFEDVQQMSKKFGFEKLALEEIDTHAKDIGQGNGSKPTSRKSKLGSKFKWAFSDKAKAGSLLHDVRELNDGLYALLRIVELRAVDFVAQSQILQVSAEAGASDLLYKAVAEDWSPSSTSRNNIAQRQLMLGANAQHFIDEQNAQIVPPPGTIVQSSRISTLQTSFDNVSQYFRDIQSSTRTMAHFEAESSAQTEPAGETVLIEWKDVDSSNPFSTLIAKRIDGLANFLSANTAKPSDFRVMNCVGYFDDFRHSRYGLLFRIPSFAATSTPVTLHDLLTRQTSLPLPELGDRFALAQAISQSILRLHDCGWVHRGLRSSNIVIFNSKTDKSTLLLRSPLIAGFTYSRPNDPLENTLEYSKPSYENDLYRHPDVLRSNPFIQGSRKYIRYEQRHDLFSLGIILLEIGLWDQVKALKKPKYTPERFLEKLISVYVPLLGHRMGATYRDVVLMLMTGSDSGYSLQQELSMTGTQPEVTDIDNRDLAFWASLISRLIICRA